MPIRVLLRAIRTPAAQMAAGMIVFAGSGYVFVVLAGRALPKDQATLATSVYFLVNVVGPGTFFALEQVASRTTSAALASGEPAGAVTARAYRSGLKLLAATVAVLALLAPVLGARTLHGDWPAYAEVLAMPFISVHLHLVRGMMAGRQRFGGYAATLTLEGGGRVVLCAAAAVAGATTAWMFGLAYIGASAVAAAIGYALVRRGDDAAPAADAAGSATSDTAMANTATAGALGGGMVALALASVSSQLLPNIAPLAVNSRLPASSALALSFSQAAVVARIPLLFFLPIQAMILPGLTAAAARGDLRTVRAKLRQVLAATTAAGALGAAVFVLVGSWALRTFFGATEPVGTGVLLMLAASTVVLMAAFTLQPALVALGRDRAMMSGWVAGCALTGVIALLPVGAVAAAAAGQIAGPAATVALLGGAIAVALRGRATAAAVDPAGPTQPAVTPAAHGR